MDGTLLLTDTLHESICKALSGNPLKLLRFPFWLLGGRASFKARLAADTALDPASLPLNRDFAAWLESQKRAGRKLVLCSGADRKIAAAVAAQVGLFDEVIASDGKRNLSGASKRAALEARFGVGGYDYAGNSADDLAVWKGAGAAVIVNASKAVAAKARRLAAIEREFPPRPAGGAD